MRESANARRSHAAGLAAGKNDALLTLYVYMQDDHAADTTHSPPEDASLAHLSQVLAHRLRGLVAGIEGYTDLLADTLETADQRELAMKILEGAARIESVLADLQLYGELRDPAILPVDLRELTDELLAPLEPADARRVRVLVEGDEHRLFADPVLLRQALIVLIQNALEASDDDGRVLVVLRADAADVCVDVRNDGTIDIEGAEEQVFVPFFTTKAQNLGVGLALARRIAELHGGSLRLTSNSLDDGICFTLTFPVSSGPR